MTHLKRSCGIWLHITSLNGNRGCGTMGKEAFDFIDLLSQSGISIWQILPINPVRSVFHHSPYSPASSFAGSPLLIDEESIIREYTLDPKALSSFPDTSESNQCKFQERWESLKTLLWLAFDKAETDLASNTEFQHFLNENKYWLEDYALFEALSDCLSTSDWKQWPMPLSRRDENAILEFRKKNDRLIHWHRFVQFIFQTQWTRLKEYCNRLQIQILGDIPIYPHFDSADVWANSDIFEIDSETMEPIRVAGVPPDYFSEDGQLWGNPLYRWFDNDGLVQNTITWWNNRLKRAFLLFSLLRIDHFRAFESYWAVSAEQKSAKVGSWQIGPGLPFFREMKKRLSNDLPLIAEDLGIITEEVEMLRDKLGIPGMKIFQFAFGGDENHPYLPHTLDERPWYYYLGTHDNNTTHGWFNFELSADQKKRVEKYVSSSDQTTLVWKMIDLALSSRAQTVVLSIPDLLEYSQSARLNIPGRAAGNWVWKLSREQLGPAFSHLQALNKKHNRSAQ